MLASHPSFRQTWDRILPVPLTVMWSSINHFHFFEPQFPHLNNGNSKASLKRLLEWFRAKNSN